MSEFAADNEDWSLQAIVRESSGDFTKNIVDHVIYNMDGQDSFFDDHHQQLIMDREFFASENGFTNELEELYKPFYTMEGSLPLQSSVVEFQQGRKVENVNIHEEDEKNSHDQIIDDHSSGKSGVLEANSSYTPKYKRRKNQHKRVVIQVSLEGLASDLWAWRKYGQKPIKGSPYPRSYYRCSSSKGCLARKQVEQSCTDPGMFIVTYTAEHNHIQPTKRNSLAGTVRQKFRSPKGQIIFKEEKLVEESMSSIVITSDSPKSLEEIIKQEKEEDNKDFGMSDFIFNDDFFSGLEEFGDFDSEVVSMCHTTTTAAQQFPAVRSCT